MTRGVRGIKAIVDEACRLNDELKAKNNRLNLLKLEIRRHAQITGVRGISGNSGFAVVTQYSKSFIEPMKAYNLLGKKINKFASCVNVIQNKLISYVSKDEVEGIKTYDTDEFGRVHLRKSTNKEEMNRLLRKLDC